MKKYCPLTNLSKRTQIIVSFLLATLVFVFLVAYWFNVAGILRALSNNDAIIDDLQGTGILKKVASFNKTGYERYDVTLSGDVTYSEDILFGEQLYTVRILAPDWYMVETLSGYRLYQSAVDLFSVEDSNGVATVKHGLSQAEYKYGDDVCSVFLNKDGSYMVEFINSSIPSYVLTELKGVSVAHSIDGGYNFNISAVYSKSLDDIDLSYTTKLPSSDIYYDESALVFLKNIPSSFTVNLIVQSNIVVVLLMWFIYTMYLVRIDCNERDFILNTDGVSIINLSLLFGLLVSIAVPFILFKGGK